MVVKLRLFVCVVDDLVIGTVFDLLYLHLHGAPSMIVDITPKIKFSVSVSPSFPYETMSDVVGGTLESDNGSCFCWMFLFSSDRKLPLSGYCFGRVIVL